MERSPVDQEAGLAALDQLISDFERCLADEHYRSAACLLDGVIELCGQDSPEALYGRALLACQEHEDLAGGRVLLEAAVKLDPAFADARHALGDLYLQLELHPQMVEQWLETLRLDTKADEADSLETASALKHIESVAQEVLASLPEQFKQALSQIPVVLESRPHPGIVAEGFDPRALGLFEGTEQALSADFELGAQAPTRIVLFTANLLASFPDPGRLEEEIEITLLHEIGHYFGLDEDEVDRLGLG